MDKIMRRSKTMVALLLCALSVAALIPGTAPAYADITAGSTVKLTGGYNVGPALSTSGSDFVAEYTFNIAGSLGYCGNIDAFYGMYGSVAGVKNYPAVELNMTCDIMIMINKHGFVV